MDMVTIPKKEYERLKKLAEMQEEVESTKRSIEDIKAGRIIRVR